MLTALMPMLMLRSILGTYPVIVATTGNGTVSADYAHAAKGTKVTLTAVPDEGFQFKEWKVISGNAAISNNSFTMPDSAVSIEAVFEKSEPIGGGGSIGGGGIGGGGQLPQGPDIVKNPDGSTTETISSQMVPLWRQQSIRMVQP